MRHVNDYTIEIDITDHEISVPEGTVFLGCELKQNQIILWTDEPVQYNNLHTVLLTSFAESGTYHEDATHVGFCNHPTYADDESFHVVARCESGVIVNKTVLAKQRVRKGGESRGKPSP